MANIKSAKKRVITSAKRAERNQAVKSAVKTEIKKVRAAMNNILVRIKVKNVRKYQNLSRQQLADRCGMSNI